MKIKLTVFAKREEGGVTVDWVVLTAAVIAIGIVAVSNILNGATDAVNDTFTTMQTRLDELD